MTDIATLAEQGLKGFDATTLTGIVETGLNVFMPMGRVSRDAMASAISAASVSATAITMALLEWRARRAKV